MHDPSPEAEARRRDGVWRHPVLYVRAPMQIEPGYLDLIDERAREEGVPRAQLVRRAVAAYFADIPPEMVGELAAELRARRERCEADQTDE